MACSWRRLRAGMSELESWKSALIYPGSRPQLCLSERISSRKLLVPCTKISKRRGAELTNWVYLCTYSYATWLCQRLNNWLSISPSVETQLEEEMVFEVETPYYELGFGGTFIEDTVVIRSHGSEIVTRLNRELRVIDA
jgi:Xaa-Pro aminopeptidase